MTLFRVDLRLQPSPQGMPELTNWPDATFTPDFAVAASGSARFEFDGKVLGVAKDKNEPLLMPVEKLHGDAFNSWLPDYIAGFALNLAEAAAGIRQPSRSRSSAKFLDQPLELRLSRVGDAEIKVTFRYQTGVVAEGVGPAVLILAEIGRALQDFMVQLLSLNPRLAAYSEVVQLRKLIVQILS